MEIANIHQAKSQLSRLVERALAGEEIIIARAGTPVVRPTPIRPGGQPRTGGQRRGRGRIADDFDDLPDDLAAPFGAGPP